jgi:hypothetical protein
MRLCPCQTAGRHQCRHCNDPLLSYEFSLLVITVFSTFGAGFRDWYGYRAEKKIGDTYHSKAIVLVEELKGGFKKK